MFSITGAPGVGKSATAGVLADKVEGCVVAEMDLFRQPELDRNPARMTLYLRSWLKLGAAVSQAGNHLIAVGFVRPHEFESAPERSYFSAIHYLALTCTPDTFTRRVRRRQKYGHLPERDFDGLHALNEWFRTGGTTQAGVTVLDNSDLTVDEAADFAAAWVRTTLGAR